MELRDQPDTAWWLARGKVARATCCPGRVGSAGRKKPKPATIRFTFHADHSGVQLGRTFPVKAQTRAYTFMPHIKLPAPAPWKSPSSKIFRRSTPPYSPSSKKSFYTRSSPSSSAPAPPGASWKARAAIWSPKKVLCCMRGAFSDKFYDVAKKRGKQAEPLQVERERRNQARSHRGPPRNQRIRRHHSRPNESSSGTSENG
jgi:hypothetical protein